MIISCGPEVTQSPNEIKSSVLFNNWLTRFNPEWEIVRVHVNAALAWKGDVRMAFANITAIDPAGKDRTVSIFLRGSTVDILPVIRTPDGKEYVVLVEQPRIAAAQMCISTPAGMVDEGNIEFTALNEIAEEVSDDIAWSRPEWLNHFATGSDLPMLVSPGGTDEDVQFCIVRAKLTHEQMKALHGRIAGAMDENERTTVHVVPLEAALPYLTRSGRPCLKTVMSLLLYQLSWQQ